MSVPVFRLKITHADFRELQRLSLEDAPLEAGAFALAGVSAHEGGTDIIVRRPILIPKDQYAIQGEYHLRISPEAINGLCALCEINGLGAVLCHSHPEDIPYSPTDDEGEKRIFDVLRQFVPANAPTASLLFLPDGVRGRVWPPGLTSPVPISEVVVLGRSLQRIRLGAPADEAETKPIYDRQVRAFGKAGQALIARTKIGIVGVGGTGSPTAEQLVRLGTQDLVLIDPDDFEDSNITRVYGTFTSALADGAADNAAPRDKKVELVADHLRNINPAATIHALTRNTVLDEAARRLLDRDIVFLCTDDHWGRSVVNQIAYQYFIPTINLGMRITAEEEAIRDAVGVVDMLRPGQPCLWCSQFLRADRIAAESMPRRAREALEREGYVEGIDATAPSVISMTTALSGMAVTLFLQLVTDFVGPTGEIARLNANFMHGTVRRGSTPIAEGCVCGKVRAFGDLKPLNTLGDLGFLE
jgi:hypothetical protein